MSLLSESLGRSKPRASIQPGLMAEVDRFRGLGEFEKTKLKKAVGSSTLPGPIVASTPMVPAVAHEVIDSALDRSVEFVNRVKTNLQTLRGTGVMRRLTVPNVAPVPALNRSAISAPISAGVPAPSTLAPGAGGGSVEFSPLTWSVWKRGRDKPLGSADLEKIVTGKYLMIFDAPRDTWLPFSELVGPIPVSVAGKKAVIDKGRYYPDRGEFVIQIDLQENPVVLTALAIAAAAGAGAWLFGSAEDSLKEVKVLVSAVPGVALKLAGIGLAGLLAWRFIK